MVDWLKSFEGIVTVTFGSISLSAILVQVVAAFKSFRSAKSLSDLSRSFSTSKSLLDKIISIFNKEEKKDREQLRLELEEKNKKDFQELQKREIDSLSLKVLSILIAASAGIETVTKINLLNEIKESSEKLKVSEDNIKVVEKEPEQIIEELKETSEKKIKNDIKETEKQLETLSDKYSRK
jgi:hypothetical protein